MASSTQDEEVHHRKEEAALDEEPELDLNKEAKTEDEAKHKEPELDLNIEAKTDDEAKHEEPELDLNKEAKTDDETKIVASESESREAKKQKVEQEVKDANQEEEKAREDEDDSEQTMTFLTRWKAPESPPERIIHPSLVEQCSRPIQKQLTTSDVKQNKLSLSDSQVRKKFQQILGGSWKKESSFSVYGPDGKVHEIWLGAKKSSFDLTIGWWTFVEEYGLKECCDFITVWMFRHSVTQRICLAIDATRFAFRKEVSKRICDAAFEDSD